MPVGILVNVGVVLLGGTIGTILRKFIPSNIKERLIVIFGFTSIGMGILSIVEIENLTIVVLALVVGWIIGEFTGLHDFLRNIIKKAVGKLPINIEEENKDTYFRELIIITTIICFSGTGIYGSMLEGMTGESTILLSKSVLDFVTVLSFSVALGMTVALISVPQFIWFIFLFFLARVISPILTPETIANFKGVAGVIIFMIGIQMLEIKEIKVLNAIPALPLILLFSYLMIYF